MAAETKKDKKKLLLFVIPIAVVLIGFVFFDELFPSKSEDKGTNQILASTPDTKQNEFDSLTKTEVADSLQKQREDQKNGRATFDHLGNIKTDVPQQDNGSNLNVRLNSEVTQPFVQEPQLPSGYAYSNRRSRSDATEEESYSERSSTKTVDHGFNSIVLPDGNKKDDGGHYSSYGNNNDLIQPQNVQTLAYVTSNQKVREGSTLNITLKEELKYNDITIPSGTQLTGITRINGSRLDVEVRSINLNNKITYVRLKAFDMDGVEGIRLKESDIKKIGKQTFDDEIDNLSGTASSISGVTGQVAGSVLRGISSSSRSRNGSITIDGGYKLILKSE